LKYSEIGTLFCYLGSFSFEIFWKMNELSDFSLPDIGFYFAVVTGLWSLWDLKGDLSCKKDYKDVFFPWFTELLLICRLSLCLFQFLTN